MKTVDKNNKSNKNKAKAVSQKQGQKSDQKGDRIAKVMARAGLCSRREAERWIEEGRVQVNGQILKTPACVVTDKDTIVVDGNQIQGKPKTRLWVYYKPAGLVTTHKDEGGRQTVFDALPKKMPRVISVGRLDLNSEGLLLLTNDGELSRHLELPSNKIVRHYRVRAFGEVTHEALLKLKDGITVEGVRYGPINAELERKQGRNGWYIISLEEGKNREIRKVLDAIGLQVNRLIRLSYGKFELGPMKPRDLMEVPFEVMKQNIPEFFK